MSERDASPRLFAHGQVTILELSGEVDLHSSTAFREALQQAIGEGGRQILVDAMGVSFMDSTGLGVLVMGERQLRPLGGALAVACAIELRRLLELTGLVDVFSLHSSRGEALAALQAGPADAAAGAAHDGRA
jgi:anti-sigma B factor antagonist